MKYDQGRSNCGEARGRQGELQRSQSEPTEMTPTEPFHVQTTLLSYHYGRLRNSSAYNSIMKSRSSTSPLISEECVGFGISNRLHAQLAPTARKLGRLGMSEPRARPFPLRLQLANASLRLSRFQASRSLTETRSGVIAVMRTWNQLEGRADALSFLPPRAYDLWRRLVRLCWYGTVARVSVARSHCS